MKLSEAAAILSAAGIEHPKDEARSMLSHFTGKPMHLLMFGDPESDKWDFICAVHQRADRKPLQYILGEVGFYREKYRVTPACLIPREDTEVLVDYAVKALADGARFIDLCTGSGCIAISVLCNTKGTSAIATDISDAALEVALTNAEKLGVSDRITFIPSDVLSDDAQDELFDAVLSNPPYIAREVYERLEPEIFHEPRSAFVGGEVGDEFYRIITPKYKSRLKPGGFIGFEIGYDQSDAIRAIASESGMSAEILTDLSGNPRVAILRVEK